MMASPPKFCFLWPTLLLMLASNEALAGSFIVASEAEDKIDWISHPKGYRGNGGELSLTVCISDASQDQLALEIPVQNAIRTWNNLVPTSGNLLLNSASDVPGNLYDIESVLVHEVGHCIGLGHTNHGGGSSSTRNFTRAGANGSFSFDNGPDNIPGSADDLRGDDINLVWFQKSNNNPFTLPVVVDSSTYSIFLEDLPMSDDYAAIAGRLVGVPLSFPNTEAVMHQGTLRGEAQRTLSVDDVATLKLGMSGVDEVQSTSDDYTLRLNYIGIQNSGNCDIPITVVPASSTFAFCYFSNNPVAFNLPERHRRLFNTRIELGGNINWYFNDVENNALLDTDGDGLSDTLENASCTLANDADTDDDGLADGVEDANQNGVVDDGETDPCDVDSDDDNIQDGTELGIIAGVTDTDLSIFVPDADPTTTTMPLDSDSDGDGVDDGVEDANFNGEVDPGESDPNDENSPPSVTTVPLLPFAFQLLTAGLVLLISVLATRSKQSK